MDRTKGIWLGKGCSGRKARTQLKNKLNRIAKRQLYRVVIE